MGRLFRDEVAQARKQSWMGSVQIRTTAMAWVMGVAAIMSVIVVGLLLAFGSHTRIERVQGRLLPVGGIQAVVASTTGVLLAWHVEEGQLVQEGEPLLEISTDVDTPLADGMVAERISGALMSQQESLRRDLADIEASQARDSAALARRLKLMQQQLSSADAEYRLRARQAEAARQTLQRIRPLQESKIVSDIQIRQYEDQLINAEALSALASRTKAEIQGQLAELEHTLLELPLRARERKSEIERALAELSRLIISNQAQQTVLIRAPGSGYVSGRIASLGEAVAEGERLVTILPPDPLLHAEVWVHSRAIGELNEGQAVKISYEAYPHQKFGKQRGWIAEVSRSAFDTREVLERSGFELSEPAYRVVVSLEHQHVSSGERMFSLSPHMALNADVLLETRPLYQVLLEPLQRSKQKAGQVAGINAPKSGL